MKISTEEKAMWLEDWKRSGKKAWSYAKENGIIPQTFCSWVKKAAEQQPAGFVEMQKQLMPAMVQPQEMVIETINFKIRIPLTVCAAELQTICSVLGRLQ